MNVNTGGGSPVVHPQLYQTTPLAVISQAEQQDRYSKQSELNRLASYFDSGTKLLKIVDTLNQNADAIVAAGGDRIFYGGNSMDYLEKPKELVDLPGYVRPITVASAAIAKANAAQNQNQVKIFSESQSLIKGRTFNFVELLMEAIYRLQATGKEPLPGGFKPINISRYGERRMKRSMRDLGWFLRYITYAIIADNPSILVVNARGLRGVIPEDVTVATIVALKEMCWKSLSYFPDNEESQNTIRYYFNILIKEYEVEKPANQLREGISNDQQGLELPQSYSLAAESRPKFVMKHNASVREKQAVVKAAYRQVFKCDIDRTYGITFKQLESQVTGGNTSIKEFIRSLGKTRLYRRLFYEPYTISRVIELAFRHFLGRGLSSMEEFQDYFEIISRGGLPALIDALVDSVEYADYFGEETVPYLRGLGQEAQECRNWGAQLNLFKCSAAVRKVPQFVTMFGNYQQPLPNQHPYGVGNDPLETQFGTVFKSETNNPYAQPASFNQDHHRLLVHSRSRIQNVTNNYSSERILKQSKSNHEHRQRNINLSNHSVEAIIKGVYQQIWGQQPFSGQHLTVAETKLRNSEISVREFVRQLAKSTWFRNLYWDHLYITKAIECIHRRLLGRPTYGRAEMNQYYDLCSKKGFYTLVDEILDSDEYLATFGEDIVPYERYLTPKGWAMRSLAQPINWSQAQLDRQHTAGEVVGQKIRENRDRLARLASQSNGHVPKEIVEAIQTASDAVDENKELITVTNLDPAEPESLDTEKHPQEEESYEYSQTTDY
ncbi:photosystem I reaction center subunit XI [Pleurocapsa sp. CCALA 161]|uniref:phycobilisome rod-core linker polypeptide n=1 Tax=Pleurocapsa sp. CCALA 161 TaxID=2107688 RepID=UPI000D082AB9|nr:phycobilisome rod-core linker polypeptide [Pleurocapsa sp. CCALA 161]PSB09974.1 photosystem I reaction center subunit XI [Pleurocapsa sp. CCALA 161]